MFASPGSLQFAAQRRRKSVVPSCGPECSRQVELEIVNVLKGEDVSHSCRLMVCEAMHAMDTVSRCQIIDFLASKNGAFASTMENNACKHFICIPAEFHQALNEDTIPLLLDFWTLVQVQILPNVSIMLYPLESSDFSIRQSLLAAFRDRVLLPVLSGGNYTHKFTRLLPVLNHVRFSAADQSYNHELFCRIVTKFYRLGSSPLQSSGLWVKCVCQHSVDIGKGLVDEIEGKPRSRTMPLKNAK